MAASFDRDQLLGALDDVARAAVAAKTRLDIAVYGGSALMLVAIFASRPKTWTLPRSESHGPNGFLKSSQTSRYETVGPKAG